MKLCRNFISLFNPLIEICSISLQEIFRTLFQPILLNNIYYFSHLAELSRETTLTKFSAFYHQVKKILVDFLVKYIPKFKLLSEAD